MRRLVAAIVLVIPTWPALAPAQKKRPPAPPVVVPPPRAAPPQTPPPPPPPPPPAEPTTVEVVSAPAPSPPPAPGEWSVGVAPSIGLTVPTSKLGPFVVGSLEIDIALPVLERRLVLALDASLTRPAHSGDGTDTRAGGAYSYDLAVTELKLGLDLVFRFFPADHKLVPYLGAGPVLHMLKTTETSDLAPGENTEQDSKIGFEVVAGLDYRIGPGMLLADLRYVYSGLHHLWTGDTNAGNVCLFLGYRFVF